MSSPAVNPQHEPTMEEILASIRKIISEDQPDAVKPAAQPVPLRQVVPEPGAAAEADADAEVLELTEVIGEEEAAAAPAAKPAPVSVPSPPPVENDITFETIEPPPKAEENAMALEADELISDMTRSAVGRAFANMAPNSADPTPGSLEAVFVQAVQGAFNPTLENWVDNHQAEILEKLKPLIREWMDENLPPLIEAAVAKEVARAASEARPRRR